MRPPDACTARQFEPFPRPSHPTPTTAVKPPIKFSLPSCRPQRPRLRIITETDHADTNIRRPIPIRHPALVKSAPLQASEFTQSLPPLDQVYHCHADLFPTLYASRLPSVKTVTPVSSACPPPKFPVPVIQVNSKKSHKRTLSDKFKNLFSALHIKKDDRIPFFQPDQLGLMTDKNAVGKSGPVRPHRSPGTASFLVTRHMAPDPDLPVSATSSSTAFSTASRPAFAEKRRLYLTPPDFMEISHFSNPTTLASTAGSSARSISSGVVHEKSPGGLEKRLGMEDGVSIRARVRRAVSMPDIRRLRMGQR